MDVLVRAVIVADILGEEVILKWYRESASSKGKRVFLEQMKKFVEWLENAEEGQSLNVSHARARSTSRIRYAMHRRRALELCSML